MRHVPKCDKCGLKLETNCTCPLVDKFFEENRQLMDDLAKLEAQEKEQIAKDSGVSRCISCMFFDCRCASGLANK